MVECSEDTDAGWLVDVPRAAVPLLLEDRSLLLGFAGRTKRCLGLVLETVNLIEESRKFSFNKAKITRWIFFLKLGLMATQNLNRRIIFRQNAWSE